MKCSPGLMVWRHHAHGFEQDNNAGNQHDAARHEVGNRCGPLQVVDLSLREYASALPAAYTGHVRSRPGRSRTRRLS
ncbi:hypothetical protein KOJCDNHJ_04018 [Xanthomonas citri pv. punicae]|nr:hypothetical protein KOJCDNHJ_04018 [Xanthomonas citri pv. punicae]